MNRIIVRCLVSLPVLLLSILFSAPRVTPGGELKLDVEQITHGDQHHFFGYIGQCRTIPWNATGRYIVALRSEFHDHMPKAGEAAEIILIDTQKDYHVTTVDRTLAWNLQQGTMLYWNPEAPATQFFFNDRDRETNKVFTVLFDIQQRKRVKEYRFENTPVGNGGVAQKGGYFVAINYARMARLRPVTGYPDTFDWTIGQNAPSDDGLFRVDIASGEKRLLVSFKQLADFIRPQYENIDEMGLYLNHTLCSRSGDHISFFLRGRLGQKAITANSLCTINPDGGNLQLQQFIGGHPEWGAGDIMLGAQEDRQVLYDVRRRQVAGFLGQASIFPKPGADISLSPDGKRFVNGYSSGDKNLFAIFDRTTSDHATSRAFSRGPYTRGELRIDPAPRWNRAGDAVLVPGFTDEGTRQMFLIRILAN